MDILVINIIILKIYHLIMLFLIKMKYMVIE